MSSDTTDCSKQRFAVSLHEIRQELVHHEEFAGQYVKTVTLSDGTTRTIELTPMIRNGDLVVEFKEKEYRSYMGLIPVRTGGYINHTLMIRLTDMDDVDAARAEWRSRRQVTSAVLSPGTSLISMPEYVAAGFTQGIEILNDHATPMKFVVDVLSAHLGLSPKDSNQTMLSIHTRGGALIPTRSLTEAQRIAAQITAEAAEHGYPMRCRPVTIGP
jgi:ATP-dependent Clp protease adapter protein ClpS